MKRAATLLLIAALPGLLGACSLQPKYMRPAPAVPTGWRIADPALLASETDLAALGYRAIFHDVRLQALIERGLEHSQDLKAAVANVAAARGLYRVQRAALLPAINAAAAATLNDGGAGNIGSGNVGSGNVGNGTAGGGLRENYSVNIGASAFELDLFGRLRSLSDAQLNAYFATEQAARATRLTLAADIADVYFTLAADRSLLAIARQTAVSAQRSVGLTSARLAGGIAPRTDLRQAETIQATARSDLANLTTIVEQDRNALELLIGGPVRDADLPDAIESIDGQVGPVPVGLASSILLRRPDVMEAEYQLRAANARIGAARAAFFPRISLTGAGGLASSALSGLFTGGAFAYNAGASASLPIFAGGANSGNLVAARAQTEAATASYQRAIQVAFRDVSDALARRATISDQIAAQSALEAAARDTAFLTTDRYRGGVASFLESLDAQRALYAAQRSLISARLLRASNLVALYRALGGDDFSGVPAPGNAVQSR
ncbi:efflux transporter outer membrane subunit [Novosphingobium sp.]|uniref:efflux transporter outer membrane subunit n=1 Tax=Novosphingobium sp. TaxID=1874826 RepID=UPI002612F604|nr:efflux transporter outer membrane subunit [Novosphingobium sp.]